MRKARETLGFMMRYLSFLHRGTPRYGFIENNGVIDLTQRLGAEFPTLRAFLAGNGAAKIDKLAGRGRADIALSDISYLPVIPNPDKIICVGLNYESHRLETGRPPSEYPTLFTRFANAQVGHEQPLIRPRESEKFDYEGEIAIVIGKAGRRIPRERAFDYIAGYSAYNDGSVRDFQRHSSQFTPGKNFVNSGSFGPWLVTRDEVADYKALELVTRINGLEVQRGRASDMIFSLEELIAYCSTFTELVPGDVIVTGTPSGVGFARKPPLYMRPGDRVEVELVGLMTLVNAVSEG